MRMSMSWAYRNGWKRFFSVRGLRWCYKMSRSVNWCRKSMPRIVCSIISIPTLWPLRTGARPWLNSRAWCIYPIWSGPWVIGRPENPSNPMNPQWPAGPLPSTGSGSCFPPAVWGWPWRWRLMPYLKVRPPCGMVFHRGSVSCCSSSWCARSVYSRGCKLRSFRYRIYPNPNAEIRILRSKLVNVCSGTAERICPALCVDGKSPWPCASL